MVSTSECGEEVITSHYPPGYHSHQSPCQIGRMEEDKPLLASSSSSYPYSIHLMLIVTDLPDHFMKRDIYPTR